MDSAGASTGSIATDGNHADAGAEAAATVATAERLLRQGEPLLAYNAVQEGLQRWPDAVRLVQLKGLALARSGDVEHANRVLTGLVDRGLGDAETLGMLARTHKDLALAARTAAVRATHLESAFRLYFDAYESARLAGNGADAFYTGINAATLAVLQGDLETAQSVAADVDAICRTLQADGGPSQDYWLEATRGEAALILGDTAATREHYASAAALARGRFGNLSSTLHQAELLAAHLDLDGAWLSTVLAVPPVIIASGHMIDEPGRSAPRFPPGLEPAVRAAILETLGALRAVAVYASAACGSDILCLEAMRELGGETHVVLPFPAAQFRQASVDRIPGGWGERFERAIAAADSVTVTSDHRAQGSASPFDYANLVFSGMGSLRAQVLHTHVRGLAVWDRGATGLAGGAASVVRRWQSQDIPIHEIDLRTLRGDPPAPAPAVVLASTAEPPSGPFRHELRSMLFADVVGYSRLSEDQIPVFITEFLGAVAQLNRSSPHAPEHVETTGDGLYMVFGTVRAAGHYALALSALVNDADWAAHGLPASMNVRIALHCGPVYCGSNPVTGGALYTGPHTSRAARIEPVTPPGQVYASSAFAAVAAAQRIDDLRMTYVGRLPLAKSYGTLGLYHVRPDDGGHAPARREAGHAPPASA